MTGKIQFRTGTFAALAAAAASLSGRILEVRLDRPMRAELTRMDRLR